MISISDSLELLFQRRAPSLPSAALAEVYDRLIWCLEDNGKSVTVMQMHWLQGENLEKLKIALSMNEVCPYGSKTHMREDLDRIIKTHPVLADECDMFWNFWNQS